MNIQIKFYKLESTIKHKTEEILRNSPERDHDEQRQMTDRKYHRKEKFRSKNGKRHHDIRKAKAKLKP